MLLVACDPLLHAEFVARERPPTSPVSFQLLSGTATSASCGRPATGKTVPRAGLWRVDRGTGRRVRLPDGEQASKISRDGHRVLITTGDALLGWHHRAVGGRHGAIVAAARHPASRGPHLRGVRRHRRRREDVGSGHAVDRACRTGVPRPPGTLSATAKGISDDGRTVQYELHGPQPIERFVDLDTMQAVDRPTSSAWDPSPTTFSIMLAWLPVAILSFMRTRPVGSTSPPPLHHHRRILGRSWLLSHLVRPGLATRTRRANPSTGRRSLPPTATSMDLPATLRHLSESPWTTFCVVASSAVAVTKNGSRAFSTGPTESGDRHILEWAIGPHRQGNCLDRQGRFRAAVPCR